MAARGEANEPGVLLFRDVRIYDGVSEALTAAMDVLVAGNIIAEIAPAIDAPADATVIDAEGRTLSPGFIDVHAHAMFQLTYDEIASTDMLYHVLHGAAMAEIWLSRGFTTIRDLGGNTFSLKRAIDRGLTPGPRIYPSGAMISQTAGHGDHRAPDVPSERLGGPSDPFVQGGDSVVADGVPEVLRAAREALRRGASQVKLAVSGGTGSESDPLDVIQFTPDEIAAAVQAAADWHTYVSVHAYNPEAIRRAIEAGVGCIEHGNLIDEATLRLMQERDVWLSPQVIVYTFYPHGYTNDQKRKHDQAFAGIDTMFTLARKIGFEKIGFGSDIITNPEMLRRINEEFVHRAKWFNPAEILRQATSNNGRILAMSGPRNPYPGKLGVIEQGALADILVIDGDPLANISILTRPEENLVVIMKDGQLHKNTLDKVESR